MSSLGPKNPVRRPLNLNDIAAQMQEHEETVPNATTIAQVPTNHYSQAEQRASEAWTLGDNQAWADTLPLPRPQMRQNTRPMVVPPVIDEVELQSANGWSNSNSQRLTNTQGSSLAQQVPSQPSQQTFNGSQQNLAPQGASHPSFASSQPQSFVHQNSNPAVSVAPTFIPPGSQQFSQPSQQSQFSQSTQHPGFPAMPMYQDAEANGFNGMGYNGGFNGAQNGAALGAAVGANRAANRNCWQRRSTTQKWLIGGVIAAVIIGAVGGGVGAAVSSKNSNHAVSAVPVATSSSTPTSTGTGTPTNTGSGTQTASQTSTPTDTTNSNVLGTGNFLINAGTLDVSTSNCSLTTDISCLSTLQSIGGKTWDVVQSGSSYFVNGAEAASTTVGSQTGAQFSLNSVQSGTLSDGCSYTFATLADVFPDGSNVQGVAVSGFIGTNDFCTTTFLEKGCVCSFNFGGTRQS